MIGDTLGPEHIRVEEEDAEQRQRTWAVQSCAHCTVLWVDGWCPDCSHQNVFPDGRSAGVTVSMLCPVCALLGTSDVGPENLSDVSVACESCDSHFFWPQRDQLGYLRSQERKWVPRYCQRCARQRDTRQSEDFRALQRAAQSLAEAYRLLKPSLKDPEKVTLRFQRTQQRAQWIIATFGHLLPQDFTDRFHGNTTQVVLGSPFDETVPSKRAILRLRQSARELQDLVERILQGEAVEEDHW